MELWVIARCTLDEWCDTPSASGVFRADLRTGVTTVLCPSTASRSLLGVRTVSMTTTDPLIASASVVSASVSFASFADEFILDRSASFAS